MAGSSAVILRWQGSPPGGLPPEAECIWLDGPLPCIGQRLEWAGVEAYVVEVALHISSSHHFHNTLINRPIIVLACGAPSKPATQSPKRRR